MNMNVKCEEWLSKPRLVAGIMTGTSVDGVDVALAEFSAAGGKHGFSLKACDSYPISKEIRRLINGLITNSVKPEETSRLHFLLAEIYADSVKRLCSDSAINLRQIDAVGVHGQTLWHFPRPETFAGIRTASTFQAFSPSALSAVLGKIVVADFRAADIALGGQGAPLVPVFDYNFLGDAEKNRVVLNIGGIANITVLKKSCSPAEVRAFDTGPGNYLIDSAAGKHFGLAFDSGGELARRGNTDDILMERLKAIPYIESEPPKSTGRDFLPEDIGAFIDSRYHVETADSPVAYNLLRTLTEYTAWSIARNIDKYAPGTEQLIASGGGTDNAFLMELLQQHIPGNEIIKSDSLGIPSDGKEALCFAYLAFRTLGGLPGNLPSVTGASREAVLGVIAANGE